jgi:lipopolysaccharide transport system permease protein
MTELPVHVAPSEPVKPLLRIRADSRWAIIPNFQEAWNNRELLYFLTLRDLKLRYKQTALGVVWTILQPLITAGIFSVVFGKFAHVGSDGVPYPLFCLAALLPWNYFSITLMRCSTSFVGNAHLLNKIYVPRLLVPISGLLPGLADFGITLVAWIGLAAFFGFFPPPGLLWKLPLVMGLNMSLALGLGLVLGSLNVRFRDISNILPFLLQALMFLTPVIYPTNIVSPRFLWLYSLNPTVSIVNGFRCALFGQHVNFGELGMAALFCAVFMVAGLWVFSRMEKQFADLL